jgi:hypothetical protein
VWDNYYTGMSRTSNIRSWGAQATTRTAGRLVASEEQKGTSDSSPQCKNTKSGFPNLVFIEHLEFLRKTTKSMTYRAHLIGRPARSSNLLHIGDAWYYDIFRQR